MLVVKVQFHFSKMTGATLLSRYICEHTGLDYIKLDAKQRNIYTSDKKIIQTK